MLLNFSDHETGIHLASLPLAVSSDVWGDVWAGGHLKAAALSSHFSLGMGFSTEREVGTEQLFQSCGIHGCRMLHVNEKQAHGGCRCCLLFFLSSLKLVTPVLYWTVPVGEVRVSLPSHEPERLMGSVRDTRCYTFARLLRNQPQDSGGGFAQGSGPSALAYLSPNPCNWFRAAIHSQFWRVWIHVTWLWAAEITHLKRYAFPPVLCSR